MINGQPLATSTPKPTKGKGRGRSKGKGKYPANLSRQDQNSDDDFIAVDPAMFDDDDDDMPSDSFTRVLFLKHLRTAGVTQELLEKDM